MQSQVDQSVTVKRVIVTGKGRKQRRTEANTAKQFTEQEQEQTAHSEKGWKSRKT